jgi:cytoskeletal protein RodZ
LPKNKQNLRNLLSGLKVWGVVAVLAALVITGFYGFQGYRYWNAWSGEKSMSKEVQRINTKLSQEIPEVASTESNRERLEQRLKDMQSSYFQSSVGNIMKTVSATARKTNVELSSLSAGDPIYEPVGGLEYEVQGLTVTAEAPTQDLYQFIERLSNSMPVMEVAAITIGNPGEKATAQMQLAFYLSPRLVTEEEGAD